SQPYDLDGRNQWIFKTNIASFTITTSDNLLLWQNIEPWYISPMKQDLDSLYEGQYGQELEYIDPYGSLKR
ncbi:MAG: hypothetical protein AAF988_06800, partial [Pseudomonadota bacterium]